MGLDLVEVVVRLEEEFEIIISDEIATSLTTPREVINCLMSLPKVNQKWSRDEAALLVWKIIEDECGIDRRDFNEDSRFVEDMRID